MSDEAQVSNPVPIGSIPCEVSHLPPICSTFRRATTASSSADADEPGSKIAHAGPRKALQGSLLSPPASNGRPCPTIVDVYGGRLGSDLLHRFGHEESGPEHAQLFATRGYCVFAPDIPLTTHDPMREIADAVLPGVDRLVEMGIADPVRLAVTGRSYGGYSTLALVVETDRFNAAISRSGLGNLITAYGQMYDDGSDP